MLNFMEVKADYYSERSSDQVNANIVLRSNNKTVYLHLIFHYFVTVPSVKVPYLIDQISSLFSDMEYQP